MIVNHQFIIAAAKITACITYWIKNFLYKSLKTLHIAKDNSNSEIMLNMDTIQQIAPRCKCKYEIVLCLSSMTN
jgi:hypothetical protein